MRFLELKIGDKLIKDQQRIHQVLEEEGFDWLIDSEIEGAKIEIKNSTIIWNDGYFNGDWFYGIFKSGEFWGTFQNGILEGGEFNGEFISGINKMTKN